MKSEWGVRENKVACYPGFGPYHGQTDCLSLMPSLRRAAIVVAVLAAGLACGIRSSRPSDTEIPWPPSRLSTKVIKGQVLDEDGVGVRDALVTLHISMSSHMLPLGTREVPDPCTARPRPDRHLRTEASGFFEDSLVFGPFGYVACFVVSVEPPPDRDLERTSLPPRTVELLHRSARVDSVHFTVLLRGRR